MRQNLTASILNFNHDWALAPLQDMEFFLARNVHALLNWTQREPELSADVKLGLQRLHQGVLSFFHDPLITRALLACAANELSNNLPAKQQTIVFYYLKQAHVFKDHLLEEDREYLHQLLYCYDKAIENQGLTYLNCILLPIASTTSIESLILLCEHNLTTGVSVSKDPNGSTTAKGSGTYEYSTQNKNGGSTSVDVEVSGSVDNKGKTSVEAKAQLKQQF